jgi:hypothetical protein
MVTYSDGLYLTREGATQIRRVFNNYGYSTIIGVASDLVSTNAYADTSRNAISVASQLRMSLSGKNPLPHRTFNALNELFGKDELLLKVFSEEIKPRARKTRGTVNQSMPLEETPYYVAFKVYLALMRTGLHSKELRYNIAVELEKLTHDAMVREADFQGGWGDHSSSPPLPEFDNEDFYWHSVFHAMVSMEYSTFKEHIVQGIEKIIEQHENKKERAGKDSNPRPKG